MSHDLLNRSDDSGLLTGAEWSASFDGPPAARGGETYAFTLPFGDREYLTLKNSPPEWSLALIAKIAEFGRLKPNWDSYGARPVRLAAAVAAIEFILEMMKPGSPLPAVVPTNQGGVQLEWHRAQADLEIESLRSGTYRYFLDDHRVDETREGELTLASPELAALLARISSTA